jgi:hypothetical protein
MRLYLCQIKNKTGHFACHVTTLCENNLDIQPGMNFGAEVLPEF